ncbi:ribosome small subunit-dependent GTPase A [Sesbania bispinosa]|nr:ribosome small subunit-dependent GTPase A [Sesbania bispinosa]
MEAHDSDGATAAHGGWMKAANLAADTVVATVTAAAALPLQRVTSATAAAEKDGDRGSQRTVVLAQRRKGAACDGESWPCAVERERDLRAVEEHLTVRVAKGRGVVVHGGGRDLQGGIGETQQWW